MVLLDRIVASLGDAELRQHAPDAASACPFLLAMIFQEDLPNKVNNGFVFVSFLCMVSASPDIVFSAGPC